MAFWQKLFGGTFESNRDEGEAALAAGRFGEAHLALERALTKPKGVTAQEVERVAGLARTCRLELARARVREADAFAEDGDVGNALDQLRHALEICKEPEIEEAVAERRKRFESTDARLLVDEHEEITNDELLAVIAGTWAEPQAEEYAALPTEFEEALLAAHDGDHTRAAELLRDLAKREDLPVAPLYLWYELGKVEAAANQLPGAIEAFDRFLEELGDDTPTEIEAAALSLKAECLLRLERLDEAEAALVEAAEVRPEDHHVLLNLGVFLRKRGQFERSLAALDRAIELMGQLQPDFTVVRERGLTSLAMGNKKEAEESLHAVIEHAASRGEHREFDPIAAVALAKLYEERGASDLAADLYRHLAVGHDTANHFAYNLEAARLLRQSGAQPELVERHFLRAEELAKNDAERELLAKARA